MSGGEKRRGKEGLVRSRGSRWALCFFSAPAPLPRASHLSQMLKTTTGWTVEATTSPAPITGRKATMGGAVRLAGRRARAGKGRRRRAIGGFWRLEARDRPGALLARGALRFVSFSTRYQIPKEKPRERGHAAEMPRRVGIFRGKR